MKFSTILWIPWQSVVMTFLMLLTLHSEAQTVSINTRLKDYWAHPPTDLCSQLLAKVAAKEVKLNSTDQETLTRSLLNALNVPSSSQLLVFSGTASQGTRVNVRNPRALYFNDEVYIGMVPNGFVELIGFDPQFGGVFYSFEKMKSGSSPVPERPQDCMRCHATAASGFLPGMITRSVVPLQGIGRASKVIVREVAGHQIPLKERFGGWHVSSDKPLPETLEGLVEMPNPAGGASSFEHLKLGEKYDAGKHIVSSSDILAHLLREHQMGFVNRLFRLIGGIRSSMTNQSASGSSLPSQVAALEREFVRYLFFAEEAALPPGGIGGSPKYVKDFTANRRPNKAGAALKDLDLSTRLFKYRCSYMIYTSLWTQMDQALKNRLYARMKAALAGTDAEFSYLTAEERRAIVLILRETMTDLPADWR